MPNTGGTGRLVIYCDGGARGNPGPAAFGYVILDDGREVDARGEFLGETTNNVAEYRGLIAAARRVAALSPENAIFRVDSELLQRQVTGRYRVRAAHLKPLHAELMAVLRTLSDWRVEHVRRHNNLRADEMANRAMDARGVVT